MTKEWEKPEDLRRRKPVLWLTMTALFMAMVVVLSMSALSIPVPGGHLYFNDVVIDTAAMLMDPLSAFIACGVGAFLGDLLFYPAPMFVSLITHGLQALVISLLCRKDQPLLALLSFLLAEAVMVLGYFLLEWALYGVASAAAAIGPNVVQGIAGVLIGMLCLLITPRLERVAKVLQIGMPMVFHYGRRWHLFSMMQKNLLMGDKSGGKCAIIVYWKGIPFPPKRRPDARKPCVKSLDKGKL